MRARGDVPHSKLGCCARAPRGARSAQSLAAIVYTLVLVVARTAFISLFVVSGNLYLIYLTNQVYVFATSVYALLLLYALGARCLRPLLFGLLLPVLFVLQFCVLVLLWVVIFFNPALFEESIASGAVTIGQLYVGDHILHVLPFVDVIVVAFVFGRDTARFASRLAAFTARVRYRASAQSRTAVTPPPPPQKQQHTPLFYDLHTASYCHAQQSHRRVSGARKLHLSHVYVALHVLYTALVPFFAIFAYTRLFDAAQIYGELPFPQWLLDLGVLGTCIVGALIFAAICTYVASPPNKPPPAATPAALLPPPSAPRAPWAPFSQPPCKFPLGQAKRAPPARQ